MDRKPHPATSSADDSALESLGKAIAEPVRAAAEPDEHALDAIYRELGRNAGREKVTDANVGPLIDLARERGDAQLELLLREWRSPCGDDPDAPDPASLQRIPPAR